MRAEWTLFKVVFYLLFLTQGIFVHLSCFDNGLELVIISAFQLQNLETDQDSDVVQSNPICDICAIGKDYCYKIPVGNISVSALRKKKKKK